MKDKWRKVFDFISEYSLYGLIFFLPISKAIVETFAGFALLGFLGKKILNPDFKFLKSWVSVFLLFFIIFSALSLFNSGPYLAKSVTALFLKWLKYIGIFLFVQDALSDRQRVRRAVFILLAGALLIGLDGLTQRFLSIEFIRHRSLIPLSMNSDLYGITASFNHYNDFGTYLIVVLSLVIALYISGLLKNISKWSSLVLTILLGTCLILTFSRGGWISFVLAVILMTILSGEYQKTFPILVIFLVLLFIPLFQKRLFSIFESGADADRFKYWYAALMMIKEHPFLGQGLGTFMDHFSRFQPTLYVSYAHNCYLQIWAESGIFSLLSFLFFTGAVLYKAVKKFHKNHDFLLLGIICALFGFLIHSALDTQFYSLQLAFLLWFLLGLLVVLSKVETDVNK
jgi:putative inorganic carbon (HCO3(-)) transporter